MEYENISLTEAEWQLMECLWQTSPLTGRQLTEMLAESIGWSRSTTLTLLRRLEEKGAVESVGDSRVKQFVPKICREDAALQETEHLLHRIYKGSVSMLVNALTQKAPLPQKEIDELYAILDEVETKRHD